MTATELAKVAGISAQTASSHLKKLEEGGLLKLRKQGRHRYFCLADDEVALVIERLIGLAERKGHVRVRTGPKTQYLGIPEFVTITLRVTWVSNYMTVLLNVIFFRLMVMACL